MMNVVKFLYNVATFPMYLNVYNIVDKAEKVINKVADMETSKVVTNKELDEAEFVESTIC